MQVLNSLARGPPGILVRLWDTICDAEIRFVTAVTSLLQTVGIASRAASTEIQMCAPDVLSALLRYIGLMQASITTQKERE